MWVDLSFPVWTRCILAPTLLLSQAEAVLFLEPKGGVMLVSSQRSETRKLQLALLRSAPLRLARPRLASLRSAFTVGSLFLQRFHTSTPFSRIAKCSGLNILTPSARALRRAPAQQRLFGEKLLHVSDNGIGVAVTAHPLCLGDVDNRGQDVIPDGGIAEDLTTNLLTGLTG